MEQKKSISVLIPVLNGEKYLKRCLSSVLAQDTLLHEIVVVDNNSTDRTKEIILSFKEKHSNIVYVFEEKRSRGAARNAGVSAVTGGVVLMTDVDCVVNSDWARRLVEPIFKGEELIATGYQYNLLPENYWAREMQRKCDYFLNQKQPAEGYISFTDTKNLAVETGLLKITLFDEHFKALEDVDFEIRLRSSVRFCFLPDVLVGHAHSASARAVWKLAYERSYWYAQLYHKFKDQSDENGEIAFPSVNPFFFYLRLLEINIEALRIQGWNHLLFFIVFDTAWKVGSAVGFAKKHKSLR